MSSGVSERLGKMGSSGGSEALSRFLRLAGIGLGLLVLLVLTPTALTYINPGHVGIVIHRVGGGVDPKPLTPDLHARNPLTTGIEEYPTFIEMSKRWNGQMPQVSGSAMPMIQLPANRTEK